MMSPGTSAAIVSGGATFVFVVHDGRGGVDGGCVGSGCVDTDDILAST